MCQLRAVRAGNGVSKPPPIGEVRWTIGVARGCCLVAGWCRTLSVVGSIPPIRAATHSHKLPNQFRICRDAQIALHPTFHCNSRFLPKTTTTKQRRAKHTFHVREGSTLAGTTHRSRTNSLLLLLLPAQTTTLYVPPEPKLVTIFHGLGLPPVGDPADALAKFLNGKRGIRPDATRTLATPASSAATSTSR